MAPVVVKLVDNKIANLQSTDPFMANFYRARRARILDGLPEKFTGKGEHAAKPLGHFLEKYGFEMRQSFQSPEATPSYLGGWTILHC